MSRKKKKPVPPQCAVCEGSNTRLVTGDKIYGQHHEGKDFYSANYWLCQCGAYCGCHHGKTGGTKSLGRPADAPLRKARGHTHKIFDPLWKNAHELYDGLEPEAIPKIRSVARSRAYKFLVDKTGMTKAECHIGMMNVEQCRQVYRICQTLTPEIVRDWHKQQAEKPS